MVFTALFGAALLAVGVATFAVLVRGGYVRRVDVVGWVGATCATVGGGLTLLSVAYDAGVLRNVLVFASVIAALTSFTVAVVHAMRHRAPAEETEPTPTGYVHAYGTYNANTVQMRRRRF